MLSGGDNKGVQGDMSRAQTSIVTERYARILGDNCRINAERFQQQFYSDAADKKLEAKIYLPHWFVARKKQAFPFKFLAKSPEMVTMTKPLA